MNKLFVLIPLAASMCFGARVGVLKNTSKCPGEQVTIDLDVEDSNNRTRVMEGNTNPPGISITSGHIIFTYCVLNVNSLRGLMRSLIIMIRKTLTIEIAIAAI